jgi:streptomycin 6-kinase
MEVWDCTPDGSPVVTDDAYLWPVHRAGRKLMLKIVDPAGDEVGAAAVLAALDGHHAVALVAAADNAILMERVIHVGPTLAEMALGGRDPQATAVLVDLTLSVQADLAGAALPGLIPFDSRAAFLATAADGPGLSSRDRALLQWGADLAADLGGDRAAWRTLHGDMHHFNALHDETQGWLMIDPKGILGPPAYDFANMILNPVPHAALVHDPVRMARMAGMVAERLAMPPRDMLAWVSLQATLGFGWSLGDSEAPYWERGARLAGELAGLRLPPG